MRLYDSEGFSDSNESFLDENSYPEIRRVLANEYSRLQPEDIEDLLESLAIDAEALEGLLASERRSGWRNRRHIRRIRRDQIRQPQRQTGVRQRVLGGVLGAARGALTGVMSGGGVGAVAGAVRGGLSGALQQPGQPGAGGPPAPALPQPSAPAQPSVAPTTTAGPSAGVNLNWFLAQPAVQQALSALLVGQMGRREVGSATATIPVEAILNTGKVLFEQVLEQTAADRYSVVPSSTEDIPRYLLDAQGEFLVDPAVPEQRAAVVLDLLEQAELEQRRGRFEALREKFAERDDEENSYEWEMEEESLYDQLDLVDAYFAEEEGYY